MTKDEALERLVEHTKPKFDKDATLYRCRFCHSFDAESFDIQHKEDCPYHQARLALTRTALSEPDAKEAECERLREGLNGVLTGGNHLALHIGTDHPPHTATFEEALKHYGPGIHYDIWCCWKNIMDARALLNDDQAVSGGE